MKDTRSGTSHDLQNSPNLRYVMAVILAFSALIGGLALVRETLASHNYGLFLIELIVIIIFASLCIWLSIPLFWQKKCEKSEKLDFKSNGKHFYGYEPQVKIFREVLSKAKAQISYERIGPPLIAVFGKSGVGKSSFLIHCFGDSQKAIHLDLREGPKRLVEVLEKTGTFGPRPLNIGGLEDIDNWLQKEIASPPVREQLSEKVLIFDQFEQVIADKYSMGIAVRLFRTLAPHCSVVIVCVRSDVLGNAIDGIRELLTGPVDVSQKLRLFELCPIVGDNIAEQSLLCGIWNDVMKKANMPLLVRLGEMLKREKGNIAMLPVFVKLVVYAVKAFKIQSIQELETKMDGKVINLVDRLLHKECASTANEELALRILFSLSNSSGVSEEFNAANLQIICSTGNNLEKVKGVLRQLNEIGVVNDVGDECYALSHEYLGELAREHAGRSMTPSEKAQIMARQSLVKKANNLNLIPPYEELCDVKNRVQLHSGEGLILLSGLLIGISRLFFWSPEGVHIGLNHEFIPAAIGWMGTSFFFWLFYGNVGKAIMSYQGIFGKVLWKLASLVPLVGWVICCFFPHEWLVVGSGVTIFIAITDIAVSRRAKNESKDIEALFKGFGITTLGLVLIFMVSYSMLRLIPDSWYNYVAIAAATVSFVVLVRSGVHFWHGWFLRDLLARIDLDISLPLLHKKLHDERG